MEGVCEEKTYVSGTVDRVCIHILTQQVHLRTIGVNHLYLIDLLIYPSY